MIFIYLLFPFFVYKTQAIFLIFKMWESSGLASSALSNTMALSPDLQIFLSFADLIA